MTSTLPFIEFLSERKPEDEKIMVALRYYIAEKSDDKLPQELVTEVTEFVGDDVVVQSALDALKNDRSAQSQAALVFFAQQWDDPKERDAIVRAFEGAATKLPVIEVGLIAMVSMYAMFLYTTNGRRRRTKKVVRRNDGTFEETEVEEFYGPTGPLQAIVSLIRGRLPKK